MHGLVGLGCQPAPVWTADALGTSPARAQTCPSTPEIPGQCATRCGSYLTRFTQTDGDCGKRADQLAELAGDPATAPYPCTGNFTASADHCSVKFDIRCPTKDASGSSLASVERGTLGWSGDAASARGDLELWVSDAAGNTRCHSSYQVAVTRR